MSAASPTKEGNDQVAFLIACIKHSDNGRPDFAKVADELGIVSKGAAAKRYERLLKANNIPLPSQRAKEGGSTPASTPRKRAAKKAVDEDGEGEETTPKKRVRKTPVKKVAVKAEETEEEEGGVNGFKGEDGGEADGAGDAVKAEDEE